MRLPLVQASAEATPAPGASAANVAGARILVVDDNSDAGDSLAEILNLLGADVRVARDGPQALDVFEAYRPSVVLLDIGMPGMNGYDVARAIRTRFPEKRPMLVALTGWGQEDDRRRAREAGFDHHLVKPVELEQITSILAQPGGRP